MIFKGMTSHSNFPNEAVRHSGAFPVEEFLSDGAVLGVDALDVFVGWGLAPLSSGNGSNGSIEGGLYAPDFFLRTESPWKNYVHRRLISKSQLKTHLDSMAGPPANWNWQDPNPESALPLLKQAHQLTTDGRLKKIVPALFSHSPRRVQQREKAYLLGRLLERSEPLHVYGCWDDSSGILGFTPEVLFDVSGGTARTMALAGTAAPEVNMLADIKLRDEHQWVVDDIVSQMTALGRVEKGNSYEWNIGTIKHLRTDISCELNTRVDFSQLVERLHPTPALGVFPRGEHWKQLREFDGGERFRFGAPFGWQGRHGNGHCLVAIRNIQWTDGQTFIGAGCGIVEGSHLEQEWNEYLVKFNLVKKYLGVNEK